MATYINIFWWHTYFRLIFGWTMKENSKTGSWHSRPPTRRQNKFKVARFHFETCYDSWYLLIVFFVTILNQKTTKFGLCWTELPFRTRISQKPFRGGVFDLGYEGYPEVGLVWAYLCMMRYLPYASCPNENTYGRPTIQDKSSCSKSLKHFPDFEHCFFNSIRVFPTSIFLKWISIFL